MKIGIYKQKSGNVGHMPAVGRRVGVEPWLLYVMGVLGVVVGVAVGVYLIRKYRERKWGWCKSKRRLEGKVMEFQGYQWPGGERLCHSSIFFLFRVVMGPLVCPRSL